MERDTKTTSQNILFGLFKTVDLEARESQTNTGQT